MELPVSCTRRDLCRKTVNVEREIETGSGAHDDPHHHAPQRPGGQDGGTELMIFGVAYLISHISKFTWLEPGDLIATGSPGGSIVESKTPDRLKAGDLVEVEVSGVGTLRNTVADEA